jgi:AbrB family looped-hinge helix DNA binding protein
MPNVVGERYQITIDKKVRDKLGVRPGDQAYEFEEDGRLVVTFIRPHDESLLGILKRYSNKPIEPITDWDAVRERAWVARSAEIMDALRADSLRHAGDAEAEDA